MMLVTKKIIKRKQDAIRNDVVQAVSICKVKSDDAESMEDRS